MARSRFINFLTFGMLYFVQGTILGYFAALNALYLLDRGLNMTDVGVLGLVALIPFMLKVFLGMLSDKVSLFNLGHRIPYILIGLLIQFACLLAVPAIDPKANFMGFVSIAFALQLGMALYDTCTDGLALDVTPEEDQSRIQAIMNGGRAIGTIIAATLVGLLAENISWPAVFWTLAGLTLFPIPFVLGIKEPLFGAERKFNWAAFKSFGKKSVLAVSFINLITFLVLVGANQLVNPFLKQELDISLTQAGMVTSLWGVGIVIGAFIGAWAMRHLQTIRALSIMTLIVVTALLGLGFLIRATYGFGLAITLVIFFGISYGIIETGTSALSMRVTNTHIAATMFAILMAFCNVGQGIGMGIGGKLSDLVGFRWTFAVFALLTLLIFPLMKGIKSLSTNEASANKDLENGVQDASK